MTAPLLYTGSKQLIDLVPLDPKPGSPQYTPRFAVRRVGPIPLQAGDKVLVTANEQFDNENRQAGGVWTEWLLRHATLNKVGVVKRVLKAITSIPYYTLSAQPEQVNIDPRWSLWVGANVGVWRSNDPNAADGVQTIREMGWNWDNWIHHWHWNDAGWDTITAPGDYYYMTSAWFDTNPSYRLPGQSIEITPRGSIQAAVFR